MSNDSTEPIIRPDSISDINIEMLFSKRPYNKIESNSKIYSKKDKKFYKKRIHNLTKSLLNNELPSVIFPEVLCAFDNYIKTCIKYFKVLDTTDIIQQEYIGMDVECDNDNDNVSNNIVMKTDNNNNNNNNNNNINSLMMRSIKITEPNALEKLVKRTITKKEVEPIIPQQKDINLKDPVLKNKGICKKKNITNKYDENVILEKENTNDKKK
jgi:hypothetical protein